MPLISRFYTFAACAMLVVLIMSPRISLGAHGAGGNLRIDCPGETVTEEDICTPQEFCPNADEPCNANTVTVCDPAGARALGKIVPETKLLCINGGSVDFTVEEYSDFDKIETFYEAGHIPDHPPCDCTVPERNPTPVSSNTAVVGAYTVKFNTFSNASGTLTVSGKYTPPSEPVAGVLITAVVEDEWEAPGECDEGTLKDADGTPAQATVDVIKVSASVADPGRICAGSTIQVSGTVEPESLSRAAQFEVDASSSTLGAISTSGLFTSGTGVGGTARINVYDAALVECSKVSVSIRIEYLGDLTAPTSIPVGMSASASIAVLPEDTAVTWESESVSDDA
jgi:hypothetical protein